MMKSNKQVVVAEVKKKLDERRSMTLNKINPKPLVIIIHHESKLRGLSALAI